MTAILIDRLSKTYPLKGESSGKHVALSEVSVCIKSGESVGIIGKNGAGKSTLLKLLSGVTFPSSGEAKIEGTFSSLLEVGTGFHPDLSGRNNIFLNASILGVSKALVHQELEEIISFSGVQKFIDQPLKTYSSGMKLRLAFSVLAHLKTDIIALDEVLAVGDSMFQVKCMDRIFDFKKQGRTILFVSHNLSAVKKLCERTIVLDNGMVVFDGPTENAIQHYQNLSEAGISNIDSDGMITLQSNCTTRDAQLTVMISDLPSNSALDLGVNIMSSNGAELYHFSNRFINQELIPRTGNLAVCLKFKHQLKPGNYPISIYVGQDEKQLIWQEKVATLSVPPYNPHGFHNPDSIQGPIIGEFTLEQS